MPKNHKQELYLKLHTLKQKDGSVKEYIREFEKLMMRSDITELKEQTITWFLGGLRQDVANMVKLQPYYSFDDVCKLAINIEKQRKVIRLSATKTYIKGTSFPKGSSSYTRPESSSRDKGKEKIASQPKNKPYLAKSTQNDKKCFKCYDYEHF